MSAFYIEDILFEIKSFLTFEEKVILGKTIKKNSFSYYDVNRSDFYDIAKIFNVTFNDKHHSYFEEFCRWFYYGGTLWGYFDELFCYTDEDYENDYHDIITREQIYFMNDYFFETFPYIYTRKLIEHIETNNLNITYDPNEDILKLEKQLNLNIYDECIDYYDYSFEHYDVTIFCKKCGLFNHNLKSCLLYSKTYLNEEKVKYNMKLVMFELIEYHMIGKRRSLICKRCQRHYRSHSCVNTLCNYCCKRRGTCKLCK